VCTDEFGLDFFPFVSGVGTRKRRVSNQEVRLTVPSVTVQPAVEVRTLADVLEWETPIGSPEPIEPACLRDPSVDTFEGHRLAPIQPHPILGQGIVVAGPRERLDSGLGIQIGLAIVERPTPDAITTV
jgi:hypothetical protein